MKGTLAAFNQAIGYEHEVIPGECGPQLVIYERHTGLHHDYRDEVLHMHSHSPLQAKALTNAVREYAGAVYEHEAQRDEQPAPEPALAAAGGK